jgi:hypothetical protein
MLRYVHSRMGCTRMGRSRMGCTRMGRSWTRCSRMGRPWMRSSWMRRSRMRSSWMRRSRMRCSMRTPTRRRCTSGVMTGIGLWWTTGWSRIVLGRHGTWVRHGALLLRSHHAVDSLQRSLRKCCTGAKLEAHSTSRTTRILPEFSWLGITLHRRHDRSWYDALDGRRLQNHCPSRLFLLLLTSMTRRRRRALDSSHLRPRSHRRPRYTRQAAGKARGKLIDKVVAKG